ncbi:MAG TPA: hypothetical protein VEJ43_04050 [Pseudolabrys sp.]|nr:hypothetical protein [Pseudolabrys sp.]
MRKRAIQRCLRAEFPLYQKKHNEYEAAVAEFEQDCAGGFSRGDLEALKSKLDLK